MTGRLFFFITLPFGLCTAPWVFTKLLKFPLANLRHWEISTIAYLDDWIIWHRSRTQLIADIHTTTNHLGHLGFLINHQKSVLSPTRTLQWLGIHWNTATFRVSLPTSFREKFTSLTSSILRRRTSSRRE